MRVGATKSHDIVRVHHVYLVLSLSLSHLRLISLSVCPLPIMSKGVCLLGHPRVRTLRRERKDGRRNMRGARRFLAEDLVKVLHELVPVNIQSVSVPSVSSPPLFGSKVQMQMQMAKLTWVVSARSSARIRPSPPCLGSDRPLQASATWSS